MNPFFFGGLFAATKAGKSGKPFSKGAQIAITVGLTVLSLGGLALMAFGMHH